MSETTTSVPLAASITRLVVLGDPHGDMIGLDMVLQRETRPDTVIFSAGDNVGYSDGVLSSALCETLAQRGILSVRGNHEAWSKKGRLFMPAPGGSSKLTPEARAWCEALPHRLQIEAAALPGFKVHLVHTLPGWGYVSRDTAQNLADQEEAHVTFCGHSHRPAIYTVKRGLKQPRVRRLDPFKSGQPVVVRFEPALRYVVDAGSLARPSRARGGACLERATYAVFDLASRTLSLHSLDKGPRIRELYQRLLKRAEEKEG